MSNTVPEGWIKFSLPDVCYFQEGPGLRNWQYASSGYPFINIRCIKEGYLDLSNVQYISWDEANQKYQHFFLNEGDYVLSASGTLGRMAKIRKKDLPLMLNTSVIRFRSIDDQALYHDFLPHYLQSQVFVNQITEESQGSAQVNFGPTHLKLVECTLPPVPEQQKITTILSSVDDVIEETRAQIDKLKDLKTGMMQELLTKGIGSDGVPHTEFKDSPVGRIPVGWDVESLINLSVNGISNGVFNDPKKVGSGYRLINVFDMYQGFGINIDTLKRLELDEKEFVRNKVEYGDVFFTRSSLKLEGIAYCNINLSSDSDITYDGHLMRVRPNQSKILPKYLAYYCLSDFSRRFFMQGAKHSTMTTIGQADIAPLPVTVPSVDEQQGICNILDSIAARITTIESRHMEFSSLKKALMQDLLTGKVRVNVKADQKESVVA